MRRTNRQRSYKSRTSGLPPLTYCIVCRKPIGQRGFAGPGCMCDQPTGNALKGAPSVGTQREALNAHKAVRLGGEPEDEAEHFYVCETCGQAVDMRKLGDVLHHEQPDHEPLPVS